MLIKILLVISIIVQTLATAYALRLVRATKYNSVWILFIVGFSLLSVERFVQLLMAGGHYVPRWWFGYLGIVVSVCLSIGVMYAHKLFKYIDRLNRQRQLLNKRILTAVLRTEEKARSRFSKELHDGLGPLLSSARMSLSVLSREERCCGPARDHRQYDLCDRRGDPFAARDIEQPLAACAQRFRTGARRAELHRQERGDARREDTLHDEPPHGAVTIRI